MATPLTVSERNTRTLIQCVTRTRRLWRTATIAITGADDITSTSSCIISNTMTDWHGIQGKIETGERLSFDEGVELFRSNDIVGLGRLANVTRERLNANL